jgi:hypothetical protein
MFSGLYRIYRIAHVDLKDQLTGFPFYLLLGLIIVVVKTLSVSAFHESKCTILVHDPLRNERSEDLLIRLSRLGFKIKRDPDSEGLQEQVILERVPMALRIQRDGRIGAVISSPAYRNFFWDTLEQVLAEISIERYEKLWRADNRPLPAVDFGVHNLMGEVDAQSHFVLKFAFGGMWGCIALFSMAMFVLSEESFAKILRRYSIAEIFLGKLLSGLIIGGMIATAFIGSMIVFRVRYASPGGLFFSACLASLSGILTGLIMGMGPQQILKDKANAVIGSVIFTVMLILYMLLLGGVTSAFFALPGPINTAARFLPLYPITRFAEWTASAGHGLENPIVRDLLLRIVEIILAEAAFVLILLRRY